MKDRLDTQRAKARAMMPEMATGRSNLGREMAAAAPAKETVRQTSKRPMPAPSPISKAAPDRYQRPGPMTTERVAAYAQGGKVKARLAESRGMERKKANARVAESRGMERAEMRKDMAQDKRMIANAVHKHEGHLHKGEPRTKFYKDGGKVDIEAKGESIDLSGDELDKMDKRDTWAKGAKLDFRGAIMNGAEAYDSQRKKGKSIGTANDAYMAVKKHYEEKKARGGAVSAPRNKVAKFAMGGAAKVRQGHGQKVGKMPKGGNPVY